MSIATLDPQAVLAIGFLAGWSSAFVFAFFSRQKEPKA